MKISLDEYAQVRELYLLKEKNLLDLTDIINIRKNNRKTSSLRFYEFILSTSPLLERSANLFFELIGLPEKGSFMADKSRFRSFLSDKKKVGVASIKSIQIKSVTLTLKDRSFFDDPFLVKPFYGLRSSGDHALQFWKLNNKAKHGNAPTFDIRPISTLENALKCLGSSYLFLRFIAYELEQANLSPSFIDTFDEAQWLRKFSPDKNRKCTLHHSIPLEGVLPCPHLYIWGQSVKSLPPSDLFRGFYWP